VGFGGIWMWTAVSFFMGVATVVQTFVSQSDGSGRAGECGGWVWQGLYMVVLPVVIVSVAVFWLAPALVALAGASTDIQHFTVEYVHGRCFGNPGLIAAFVFTSFFRGIGDTRTPLYANIIAVLFNAVLDYGLIFGELGLPEWGVYGAGFATAVSEWLLLLILLLFFSRSFLREHFRTRRESPSLSKIGRLLRTGAPIGGQWLLEMTSFAAFSTLIVGMGDIAMAASQAFLVLLSVSFMQALGISIGVSTLVGRYIGAGDLRAAERTYRSGIKLGWALSLSIALIYLLFPGTLMGVFTDEPGILAVARPLLIVGAFFQIFDALAAIVDGALRGAGDTLWPFVARLSLAWGLQVPLAYVFGIYLDGGFVWAWVGSGIYIAILCFVLAGRFRSGAWKRIEI
jgi:MATE family multidrug resistance protein